ncbi:hypothetical protein B9T10_03630 [Wohlfahrtiimonas chitiniclastica]|uniref:HK97 gp10 family phage protein n=1 Tax=Wohlfahrtiimonas chitiniclastica TaxID=400946 RepID=UPI000B985E40|nr:HK97 gp10 family phage protein [Wohlfahrtiimonas chitiniclastica]OYQ90422.1 hypothetical protein B9T10_03630 [Wohlfahrtiimonas chitiniclastica]
MSIKDKIAQRKNELFLEIKGNIRNAAYTAFTKIQTKTPVDTGETRRAWAIAKESDQHYVITNPLPHINVLEYGLYPNPPKKGSGKTINGYSTQAPMGFVRISLEEVKNEFS